MMQRNNDSAISVDRTMSHKKTQTSQDELNPAFVLNAMRRWWKVATAVGLVLSGIAALAVFLFFEPMFEAQAWIRIQDQQPAILFGGGTGRSGKFVETQRELLRSPRVLRRALSAPEIAAIPEVAAKQRPVDWLRENLQIGTVGRSELFRISLQVAKAEDAVALVDGVVNAFDKVRRETAAGQRFKWVEFLENQKDRRETEVKELRDKVRALAKAAGVDSMSTGSKREGADLSPLGEIRSRLAMSQVEQEVVRAQIDTLEKQPPSDESMAPAAVVTRSVAEHPEVMDLRSKIAEQQSYLEQLNKKAVNPEQNPAVQQVSKQIVDQEKALERLGKELEISIRKNIRTQQQADYQSNLDGLRRELANLETLEEVLRERYEETQDEQKEVTGDTVELDFARMELAEKQEVLNLLNRRIIEYRTEDTAPQRVTVLDTAEENFPTAPVEEYPLKKLGLAMLLGFFTPFALAIGWERLVRRISDAESMERQTHLSMLGEVAHLPTRTARSQGVTSSRLAAAFRMFEESIDNVRTSLVLSEDLQDAQVLAVTSATKGEGKTSFSSQLAVSLFRASGQPTLLVDGDLRAPDLHRVFDSPQSPGLAEVLAGTCSADEAVVETDVPGLMILPAGDARISPHRLMNNGELKQLIAELRERYHHIVIDTPPVLIASESLVLNKMSDAVVVCAMRDLTRSTQVREACKRLSVAGCYTAGGVLNGVPTHRFRYAYGHPYGDQNV